ncbi:MAG: histidine kinase [Saprospiraceae bacterium]
MSINQLLRSKFIIVSIHISAWIILFILPVVLRQTSPPPGDLVFQQLPNREYLRFVSTLMNLSFIPLFYLNAFFLIPQFFNRRKWPIYLMLTGISIYIIALINIAIRNTIFPNHTFPFPSGIIVFISTFILLSSTAFYYIQKNILEEKLRKEKAEENLKTELSFLRSQVSPHFLFNILNNMVSLARKKSDLLEPALLKLSGLLQYMLYESDDEKINITKEIEYLDNYIDLQKLRFGNDVKINFEKEISISTPLEVVPMILIPFVENAFKHGVVFIEHPEIHIQLIVTGQQLQFNVKNKYNPFPEEKDKSSGIGLQNVKRRLSLLYPDALLEIIQNESEHIVNLSIKL